VPDDPPGGGRQWRGAVRGSECVAVGIAAHVDDFGDEPSGNKRPDAVQVGQGGAGSGDQVSDLRFSWAASPSTVRIR
jgi:hypothetical protein